MSSTFKYFAFISYNSKDQEWGRKLQRKLEHYKLPATLCSEHNLPRNPIKPVFFAPTDIQPGGLTEELQERLRASRHIIVICSPNSAKSAWVGKEIEYFHSLGRTKNIHLFIVDGVPLSGDPETECYNPILEKLGIPEILGANIHEKVYRWPWLNCERAYVQLISKLLGVEFDSIWQRHKRHLVRNVALYCMGAIAVLAALTGIWVNNQPVDVLAKLNETSVHNENLPPLNDAIITMTLDNETKTDTIQTLESNVVFNNIPHRFLNTEVRFTVTCNEFFDIDTMLTLTKDVVLNIKRDPSVYGNVHFNLWNPITDKVISNAKIEIEGYETISDDEGKVSVFIPLKSQKKKYQLKADFPLGTTYIIMPCGENDVIMSK